MGSTGLEPACCCQRQPLKLVCLPIPPRARESCCRIEYSDPVNTCNYPHLDNGALGVQSKGNGFISARRLSSESILPPKGIAVLAQLVPFQGGDPITIDKDVTIVGRQAEHCDLVLDRKSVSKIHCIIARTDGLLFVRDLDSTNGTKVNGQRIIRGALLPGDELAFAGEKFRVHLGPAPAARLEPRADRTQALEAYPPPASEPFDEESNPPVRRAPNDNPGLPEDLVE